MYVNNLKYLYVVPYPPSDIRVRSYRIMEQLINYASVDLIYIDDGSIGKVPDGVKVISVIDNRSLVNRLFSMAFAFLKLKPLTYYYYYNKKLNNVLVNTDLGVYDAVIVERIPLQELDIHPKWLVFDAVDCFSGQTKVASYWSTGIKKWLYMLDSMILPKFEVLLSRKPDVILVTSDREKKCFEEIGVTNKIETYLTPSSWAISNHIPKVTTTKPFRLSFHGKLSYIANSDAISVLNDVIAPVLDNDRYQINVIGGVSEKIKKKNPNLNFLGFIDDLTSELQNSQLSIFPMRMSVGISTKTLESLACGIPVIATCEVAKGLPEADGIVGKGVFVVELRDFSNKIEWFFTLSEEERIEISINCINYIKSVCDPVKQEEKLLSLLAPEKTK